MVPALPDAQQQFLRHAFPDTGDAWIAEYPSIIESCIERWSLDHLQRAEGGYPSNVVCYATAPVDREVVLKLGHPHPELLTEAIALRAYDGRLTPRLLDEDPEVPALLMERVLPGDTLRHSPGRQEFDYSIFGKLGWRCDLYEGLPFYRDWMNKAFCDYRSSFGDNDPFVAHIDRAESLFSDLGEHDSWFLHGDLHHENLLADEDRGWIAIDPKGVIGPRVMECGRFLHNFLDDELSQDELPQDGKRSGPASIAEMTDIADDRCRRLAPAMGVCVVDVARAGYIDAVLGTCWTLNDGQVHSTSPEAATTVKVMERLL